MVAYTCKSGIPVLRRLRYDCYKLQISLAMWKVPASLSYIITSPFSEKNVPIAKECSSLVVYLACTGPVFDPSYQHYAYINTNYYTLLSMRIASFSLANFKPRSASFIIYL